MEKKKNNKKLFAIIAASALAFVLTVALSVSITLAYFGQAASGSATLSTGGSVLVGTAETFSDEVSGLVPGQKVTMDIKATVKSSTKQDAFLVAIVDLGDGADSDLAGLIKVADTWKPVGTAAEVESSGVKGAVYVYGTKDAATKISATNAAEVPAANIIALTDGTVEVPTGWDNTKADKTVNLKVTFVAVQTPVDGAGALVTAPTAAQLKTVVESVGGFTWTQA